MCASTTGSTTQSSGRVKWHLSECKHNHFNHSGVKHGKAWLCCRDCGIKWRAPHPLGSLCPEFYETRGFCSLGSSCSYLHVHRFKCTERSPTHDDYVGEDRDDLLRECAIVVLTEYLPEQPFPRDVMRQIRVLYEAHRGAATGSATGVYPATPPSQRFLATSGGQNTETPAPLMRVTTRYVPTQRALFEQRSSMCLSESKDTLRDGPSQ